MRGECPTITILKEATEKEFFKNTKSARLRLFFLIGYLHADEEYAPAVRIISKVLEDTE